jgi:hypothetical protein
VAAPIPIKDVYGAVGTGFSIAHDALAMDGVEYVVKGARYVRKFRHVAVNELVAARLAIEMGLPIPDHRVLSHDGELFFGSVKLPVATYHPYIDDYFFSLCGNQDSTYELIVFDTWICNKDRHSENLWVRCSGDSPKVTKTKRCAATTHSLMLIDHEGGFLPDSRETTFFDSLIGTRVNECVQLSLLKTSTVDPSRLGKAIATAESVSDEVIRGIVYSVPEQLLPLDERDAWIEFLVARRNVLRQRFTNDRGYFYPWLRHGDI